MGSGGDKRPLYDVVTDELRGRIVRGDLNDADRLPPEPELAEELQVSRSTVREAVRALEKEGLIIRRHGLGSFIRRHSGTILSGLNRLQSFSDLIRMSGREPSQEMLGFGVAPRRDPVWPYFADAIDERRELYEFTTRLLADEQPVMHGRAYAAIDADVNVYELMQAQKWPSLTEKFRFGIGYEADWALLSLHAMTATAEVAASLDIQPGTALLQFYGPTYDAADKVIWYTEVAVLTDLMTFVVTRR